MPYKNPEDIKASNRRKYERAKARLAEDPEFAQKQREVSKRWYATRGKAPEYAARRNRKQVLSRYALTEDAYRRLLAMQGFACAICGAPHADEKYKRLAVDHCHVTGKVRGLLCGMCNTGIGKLRDNPDVLLAAVAYLERHHES